MLTKTHPIAALPLAALVALTLSACASNEVKDPTSRYYEMPAGSVVVIHSPVEISAGSAHTIIQGGAAVTLQTVRRYEPFCELEVNDVFDRVQTVAAGEFEVTRVVRQQHLALSAPIQLAGVGIGIGIGTGGGFSFGLGFGTRIGSLDNDRGSSPVLNTIHLRLRSPAQPNVRELRCTGGWADTSDAVYPTLAEMRKALGGIASIQIL